VSLLGSVVLTIAHNADFDRRFLEKRLPVVAHKHWACSRSDIDWKAESVRSSALEFVAYSLGFFHDGHMAASDCRAIQEDRSAADLGDNDSDDKGSNAYENHRAQAESDALAAAED